MIEERIKRFIDHYKDDAVETQYKAGIVNKYLNGFMIAYEQFGAKETFSVGQPVYDEDGNIMGYLGIGLFANLNYSTEGQQRIPCEHWTVCLPTKYCVEGKRVYTYWQKGNNNERVDSPR